MCLVGLDNRLLGLNAYWAVISMGKLTAVSGDRDIRWLTCMSCQWYKFSTKYVQQSLRNCSPSAQQEVLCPRMQPEGWILSSSGLLRGVHWFETDVSELPPSSRNPRSLTLEDERVVAPKRRLHTT